jgi:hypothetical protein
MKEGEIIAHLKGLKDLFNEKFETNDNSHKAILEQVIRTNGRVTTLEAWKNRIIGGFIISNLIIIPIVMILVKQFFDK